MCRRRQFAAIDGPLLAWEFELKDAQGNTLALIDRCGCVCVCVSVCVCVCVCMRFALLRAWCLWPQYSATQKHAPSARPRSSPAPAP
jgi:hypothetical protein